MPSKPPQSGPRRPSRPLSDFEEHTYQIAQRFAGRTDAADRWSIDIPALNLTFDSASLTPTPSISFTFTIAPKHCNYLGNLHGGCAATLFDALSSMILLAVSKPGFFQLGGVSRHLNVTYLRPVREGEKVRLRASIVNVGKRLALLRGEIVKVIPGGGEGEGEVCMVCDHEKANTDPGPGKL
ncbi:PaaI family thioesterase [Aspergillus undulatus]|uniref:PaaI family thioesterase n=1 Tax=Aspergillus undulatus TaxID=1810928 RepID=UPI003CCDB4D7